ncbi:PEPxxWA-CTERM sorting domain-containing protein [Polymorphobacter fuscus]|uniref:PEPxxWA-CTERM sorting domain-containing protein n=1 Tax=Sandarakinorhabdus fusca TaxID=1439888 RepID=A0A7C9GP49_9SPHN|nr:PEPxxWA-CTERM sorting domain-containing protein [Polymorphobacter fuscus]KAB7647444.1 PEP-CTERM sorting domain-containing protein [Polymorphobacter fuscus]MQT16696.1 PEPxxWA-CTERM sorting domain-containing protein [Polymorphobacter fuscus]NJC09318.1 hypothetical protein [Polymorphobacter fuscus]
MVFKRFLLAAATIATVAATPASAVILLADVAGAGAATTSVTESNISLALTVTALTFSLPVATTVNSGLTNISSFANAAPNQITQTAGGLGINGGGSGTQMDTNTRTAREAFLLTGSDAFYLRGLKLTAVDADDTLQVYGVNTNGSLVDLGYGTGFSATVDAAVAASATIKGGAGGTLIGNTFSSANGGTSTFGLDITTRFDRYILTTRAGGHVNFLGNGGQGYALSAITAEVPEPATWGMMILGFGMVGIAARRRKAAVAA